METSEVIQYPDSPDYNEVYSNNSDDLQPTSKLDSQLSIDNSELTIVGTYDKRLVLGRGGASTIKIGRRNRQISRAHVAIDYNEQKQQFELTVLGLNGACIDHVHYSQHGIAPLYDHSLIDVLGDHIHFRVPLHPPQKQQSEVSKYTQCEDVTLQPSTKVVEDDIVLKKPENEILVDKQTMEQQEDEEKEEEEDEEEDYPEDLVPNEALSPEEKELSPELEDEEEDVKEEEEVEKVEQKDAVVELMNEDKHDDMNKEVTPVQEEKKKNKKEQAPVIIQEEHDYAEVIIDALVFSRASSMPISDICSRILKANPVYAKQPRDVWVERIRSVLKEKPFFGEIQRNGKTADGSPTENLYYYNSELDPVEWRRTTYTQVGRSARKCTLKDKQYFWKIPPKLGRHRSSYIPPPAKENDPKKRIHSKAELDQENIQPKKTKTYY